MTKVMDARARQFTIAFLPAQDVAELSKYPTHDVIIQPISPAADEKGAVVTPPLLTITGLGIAS